MKTKFLFLSTLLLACTLAAGCGKKAASETEMVIVEGKQVTLNYQMKVENIVIDSTDDKGPFQFVYGTDPVMPGIAKNIGGLKAGDSATFFVEPMDAFGEIDPAAVIEIPKEKLPEENIAVGNVFSMNTPTGQPINGIVEEIREDSVMLNFNHPLAGKTLEFNVEVIEVI